MTQCLIVKACRSLNVIKRRISILERIEVRAEEGGQLLEPEDPVICLKVVKVDTDVKVTRNRIVACDARVELEEFANRGYPVDLMHQRIEILGDIRIVRIVVKP